MNIGHLDENWTPQKTLTMFHSGVATATSKDTNAPTSEKFNPITAEKKGDRGSQVVEVGQES